MDELQHDRVPGQTLTQTPAQRTASPLPSGAILSIRLWTDADSNHAGDTLWQGKSAAIALTLDVIAASEGVPSPPSSNLLSVTYPDIQPALMTARRLQWALEGLVEDEAFKNTAAVVLIHEPGLTPREAQDEQAPAPLTADSPSPGRILVTPLVFQSLSELPGLFFETATEDGLRELVWSTPSSARYQEDEQAISLLIQARGLDAPIAASPAPVTAPASGSAGDADLVQGRHTRSAFDAGASSKWIIAGGIAAVLLLVIVIIAIVSHKKSDAANTANTSGQSNQSPGTITPPKPRESIFSPAHPVPPPTPKAPKTDAKIPRPVDDHCDLSQADIARYLDRAERSLHAGNLAVAQSSYESVSGCASARERAQAGLKLVKARQDAKN